MIGTRRTGKALVFDFWTAYICRISSVVFYTFIFHFAYSNLLNNCLGGLLTNPLDNLSKDFIVAR